jgi:Uma2 family endonuclease
MATDVTSSDPLVMLPPELQPHVDHLVTEDDTPVDNIFSEKQQRLLVESLRTSWPGPGEGRPYVAMANVGLFYSNRVPAVVPDFLLSLDVAAPADPWPKYARSYFIWEYGKPPEVVIEVVSNRKGGEDTNKLSLYSRIGIRYYAIFDPDRELSDERLRVHPLHVLPFKQMAEPIWFPEVGLGLRLWDGQYEDMDATWLRWVDAEGSLISTGKERADAEQQRADVERQRADAERERADAERQRAETEQQRADRLAEQLRQLGVEPHGT